VHPARRHHVREGLDEKIIVLEETEETQVDAHAQPEPEDLPFPAAGLRHFQPGGIVEDGRENEQEQKPPVPTTVKKVAGRQQKQILSFEAFPEKRPIEDKYYWQENRKTQRIEKHILFVPEVTRLK
jgi:hypothetical protein